MDSKSISLFDTEAYGVRLEYTDSLAIVHLRYSNKMNKAVFKDMVIKLEEWYEFLTTAGYPSIMCAVFQDDEKMNRLVTMLKFKYLGAADNMFVYKYGE